MGLNYGMNEICHHGVYINDTQNTLLEYRVFHKESEKPSHIIITNLRDGKTHGPIIIVDGPDILQEAEFTLNNFAQNNYLNI